MYPPVDTEFYTPASNEAATTVSPTVPPTHQITRSPNFLVVSALVPYKRVDLAMMAAKRAGVGLTVVGNGPERQRLERLTGDGVQLIGWRPDEEVRELYRTSTATVLPGEEDFGIVPVEAQACGRPVVALARGGALDTVIDGQTGVLVADPTVAALAEGLTRAASMPWNQARIRVHAERFSRARFISEIRHIVDDTLNAPPGQRW